MRKMPLRTLHLRSPTPFSDEEFQLFVRGCDDWKHFVMETLARGDHSLGKPSYELEQPTLSSDKRIASLTVGGLWTTGSRARFENGAAWRLSQFFPFERHAELEEGLTELNLQETEMVTHWRRATTDVAAFLK